MKAAIITIAGISSRFNKDIPDNQKKLKAIFSIDKYSETLLYHLLKKCCFADKIIIVGGYKFNDLLEYVNGDITKEFPQIVLVQNKHFEDLASGYSLYLGVKKAFEIGAEEILFVEGDLDIDNESFLKVIKSNKNVLTYTNDPIYANKSVVLYRNKDKEFKYAFNSEHGLLSISEPFTCILNSGQTWKFKDVCSMKRAIEAFHKEKKDGTNLWIIQRYLELVESDDIELICLKRWTNCNTREDFNTIRNYWEAEL